MLYITRRSVEAHPVERSVGNAMVIVRGRGGKNEGLANAVGDSQRGGEATEEDRCLGRIYHDYVARVIKERVTLIYEKITTHLRS